MAWPAKAQQGLRTSGIDLPWRRPVPGARRWQPPDGHVNSPQARGWASSGWQLGMPRRRLPPRGCRQVRLGQGRAPARRARPSSATEPCHRRLDRRCAASRGCSPLAEVGRSRSPSPHGTCPDIVEDGSAIALSTDVVDTVRVRTLPPCRTARQLCPVPQGEVRGKGLGASCRARVLRARAELIQSLGTRARHPWI